MIAPVLVYFADPEGANTPIMADPSSELFTAPPVRVTTTTDLAQLCPLGWPTPPGDLGVVPVQWYPHTIPSGTTMIAFACVAAALIAANAAVAS